MEAVPRLPMISCDIKVSPSNTDFEHTLKKYIRDHYHEDPDLYSKEIKELESLRQTAIKAQMDYTGCSTLKRYYSQLHKLQSRFPMTDDGPACVPFMWTDIYSGVAFNITDIEYEQACILYNIGALHSKLGTMDSRCNVEGMKIACTHFQCAAWAFIHLRDTYPQPKGSDMSHDLLAFFINIMLAQAQECILEKSMLDSRKASITAKIAAQVVDYYKNAVGIMASGSPSTDTGSILDIVGSKIFKTWKKFIEFKMSYYMSISHLYMGNQAEENQKWGERVAWFQSAYDHLTEAFKIAKNIDRDDLNEPLTFTMDVIGGKHSSSKKENEFVYHDKVPALTSLPELKGASLVKGIPFNITDPEVCGPDIFARLVPMEAHETSSLYSEEKAKLLRSMVAKIEGKNEELMAYLSSLQLESGMSFQDEEKIPQELLEKCAAMSVRPNAISDLKEHMNELLSVSRDVDSSLKSVSTFLLEEEKKEQQHQESFGKRVPNMIIVELKKEYSKYEEAHRKAVESNNTLQSAVDIHITNLTKLLMPLEELAVMLPTINAIKSPENIKAVETFNLLVDKVEEMRKQRQFLEQQLRDNLIKDDITKTLVTIKKKEDFQQTFQEELKKHSETVTYLEQNLSAQDKILFALTEANAQYADTRKAMSEINHQRHEMVCALINSFDAYEDLVSKIKKGLEFYQKLQSSVARLLTRVRGVTKVQDEERTQIAGVEFRRSSPQLPKNTNPPSESQGPKLKDFLPYMTKQPGGAMSVPSGLMNSYSPQHPMPVTAQFGTEPMRQATLGGPADFNRKLKPGMKDSVRPEDSYEGPMMGARPTPVGSEQTPVSANFSMADSNSQGVGFHYSTSQQWPQVPQSSTSSTVPYGGSYVPYQYPSSSQISPMNSSTISQSTMSTSNVPSSLLQDKNSAASQGYSSAGQNQNNLARMQSNVNAGQLQPINPDTASQGGSPRYGGVASIPETGSMPQINGQFAPSPSNSPSSYVLPNSNAASGTINGSSTYQPSIKYNEINPPRSVGISPTNSITSPLNTQRTMQTQWPGAGQTTQQVPATGYNMQNPVFSQNPSVNNYQQVVPPAQYYQQTSGHQSISSVTASMDTRTSTYNSSQNITTNPNVPGQQNTARYLQNYPDPRAIASSQNGNINMPSPYHGQPVNQNYSNPSLQCMSNLPISNANSYNYPNSSGNVPFNSNQTFPNPPQGTSASKSSTFVGAAGSHMNLPPNVSPVISPNHATQPTGTTFPNQTAGPAFHGQQNYQQPSSLAYQQPPNSSYHQPPNPVYQQPPNPVYQHPQNSVYQQPQNTVYQQPPNPVHQQPPTSGYQQPPNPVYQQPPNSVQQYNYAVPNTGFPVANQQLQPSLEAVQPLQPSPTTTPQNRPEAKSPATNGQPVVSEKSNVNVLRDLITPPLEQETSVTDSADKDVTLQVLKPQVIDLKSITQLKEKDAGHLVKDPLEDSQVRAKFVSEVEKYERFVEGLVSKSLNGTTPLDQKWKELIDAQDKESRKMSISVARCCPLKNRFPDVMPYDSNRVKLSSAKDDYINASHLKDICPGSPVYVITQAPLPTTYSDFWLMVWEQQVETLICLLPDSELKNHVYFPKERGSVLPFGGFETTLQSHKDKNGFVERMINVAHIKNRTSRVVVHLQFTQWPVNGIPQSPAPLLQFMSDVLSYHKQQRTLLRPVVVHCSAGIGRSGCFCLILSLVNEMNNGNGPRDVAQVATNVSQQRKYLIQDKEQLKFCYDTVLYYAQDLLMKTFEDKLPGSTTSSSHVRHPSEDFILGSGGLAKLQSGMEKMGLASDLPTTEAAKNSETEVAAKTPSSKANISAETSSKTETSTAETGSSPQHEGGDVSRENSATDISDPSTDKKQAIDQEMCNNSSDTPASEKVTIVEPEVPKDNPSPKSAVKKPPSITSLLDPSNFTLDAASSPGKRKITKENFASSRGSLSNSSLDSADPLSQLDPLWSLKK
ncbi:hypothetical protein JTE90_008169 [Oedothorax gibbosus]|uniref:Tyrosine-protein phosphatase non-receptor type 23 n=1 Tax=Oedothorax gibbosus TaxID=931172 RepID=A0AAV6VG07_9ARAC|nr:hypothetical protein JTE90_008169 [Oedothorax gibbosus]